MDAARFALGLVALVVPLSACAGTQFARTQNLQKLPSDGSLGGPPAEALVLQQIAKAEWDQATAKKLKPACDARATPPKADAALLDASKKVVAGWAEFKKKTPPPKDPKGATVGDVLGMKRDNTRRVDSFSIECGPEKGTLQVNGTTMTFDLAWIVNPTTASQDTVIMAMSFKDYKVAYVKLGFGTDPKNGTDDTVVFANVSAYMPKDADEPLVRDVGTPQSPLFETLAFGKGATEGFYYYVPRNDDLSTIRYLGVGRFKVGP